MFHYTFLSVLIQQSTIAGVPWCYFPTDYGYSVSNSQQTLSGMTVDINRNMRYRSSNRPGSPDINNLHVEIIYHKSDMLQFKVSVFLPLRASGGATSLPVTVFFFKFNASILLACLT